MIWNTGNGNWNSYIGSVGTSLYSRLVWKLLVKFSGVIVFRNNPKCEIMKKVTEVVVNLFINDIFSLSMLFSCYCYHLLILLFLIVSINCN